MKVAIITFQRAHNYGSILQAYALQKYISENEYVEQCDIIDFSNENQQEMYRVFKKRKTIKNIIKNGIALVTYPLVKREYDDFEFFINDKLHLTLNKYSVSTQMRELERQYDVFVSGSDQVWNINCEDADDAYFLNFVEKKPKIAYAPSFGAQNILTCAKDVNIYRKYISEFSYVSIREKNGRKWLKELIGQDVPLLIDPTMFYDKEQWYDLMAEPQIDKPYILYYSFHFTQEVNRAVYKISKRLGLPVIVLSSHAWVYSALAVYGFKLARHAGPAEFLRLVNDAEIVLSNSFHGTVFSTIFEKNFWFLYGSVQNPLDDRATTMVEQMGIADRILTLDKIDDWDFYQKANYDYVAKCLYPLRTEAFKYLDDIMEKYSRRDK